MMVNRVPTSIGQLQYNKGLFGCYYPNGHKTLLIYCICFNLYPTEAWCSETMSKSLTVLKRFNFLGHINAYLMPLVDFIFKLLLKLDFGPLRVWAA